MENFNKKSYSDRHLGWGILFLTAGIIFLLRNEGIDIPYFVFNWHTGMLALGLWIGYRRNFNGGGWLALVIIGGLFTLRDITNMDLIFSQIGVAAVMISLGLYIILRPSRKQKYLDDF